MIGGYTLQDYDWMIKLQSSQNCFSSYKYHNKDLCMFNLIAHHCKQTIDKIIIFQNLFAKGWFISTFNIDFLGHKKLIT